uniref:Uncharacterized protein n=1 Tax=Rousettus aegyptiacus TaxID=9407 RepID=A0A7J8F0G4_ROUAE|nr:hypothetical protein HJG63_012389 [Rousettus aegyptiacus]
MPVNNPIVASACLSERKSCTPLTLNQKLEIIKLNKEGTLTVFCVKLVNAKEKFFKETKDVITVNTQIIRKQNNLFGDMEKVLMAWKENETSHLMPLSQSLIQGKVLTLINSTKAERGEGAAEES